MLARALIGLLLVAEVGTASEPACAAVEDASEPAAVLSCSSLVLLNCSAPRPARVCPPECPFLEPSALSPCAVACLPAGGCGSLRPALAFADADSRTCQRCPSPGCSSCNREQCLECREGFSLAGGVCSYDPDRYLGAAYACLGCLLGVLGATSVLLLLCCDRNRKAWLKALEHRERCMPHRLENWLSGDASIRNALCHSARPRFPLNVNVHNRNIVGVGLALYYNQLVFVAVVALGAWLVLAVEELFSGAPSGAASDCGLAGGDGDAAAERYAWRRCRVVALLWGMLLAASLLFARLQKLSARRFEQMHARMEQFALSVKGLPSDATDPREVHAFFEGLFLSHRRPVIGVSIGYDFLGQKRAITRMLDAHLEWREAAFAAALGIPGALADLRAAAELDACAEGSEGEAETRPLTRQPQACAALLQQLRCSGEAILVLEREQDVEELFAMWDQAPGVGRSSSFFSVASAGQSFEAPPPAASCRCLFRGAHMLRLREVTSEPTSIIWEHMGTDSEEITRRLAIALALFAVVLYAFYVFGLRFATDYVLRFARAAGQAPTVRQTCWLGVIGGIGNSVIANCIWLGVPRLGFPRKDQADIVTFLMRLLLVLLNTIAVVMLTARKLAAEWQPEATGGMAAAGAALRRAETLGQEGLLADAVVQLFLTGTFSVSYVCFFCLYPLTYIQAALAIRTGLLGSRMSARECEKLLEPMEIWLPWDYASHIQLSCCAFFPLLLAQPSGRCATRVLCAVLLVWCGLMYCAQRVIHLRASRETFFTTARLDTAVLYAWGLPLSQLALTAVYWAARACGEERASAVIPACCTAFGASLGVYWCLLCLVMQWQRSGRAEPLKAGGSYWGALARLRYSYFNTNPVHVLMGDHLPRLGLQKTTWYHAGKVHLQTDDPKGDARLEAQRFAAEHAPDALQEQRPLGQRLFYRLRVWATGAPEYAYESFHTDGGASLRRQPSF